MQNKTTPQVRDDSLQQQEKKMRRMELYIKLAVYGGFIILAIFAVVSRSFNLHAYRGDFVYRVTADNTEISIRRVQTDSRRTFGSVLNIPSHMESCQSLE